MGKHTIVDLKRIQIEGIEKVVRDLEEAFVRDGKLDELRARRLNDAKKDLINIKKGIEGGQLQLGLNHEQKLNKVLTKIAEMKEEDPELLPIKQMTEEEFKTQLVENKEEAKRVETEAEKMAREYNISLEAARIIAKNPGAAIEKLQKGQKLIEKEELRARKEKEEREKAKKRKKAGIRGH